MRKQLLAGAAAAAVVMALAGPASAAPTNAPRSLTFEDTQCTNLNSGQSVVTDFVVNGNGNWGGANSVRGQFQPLDLDLTFTVVGHPELSGSEHQTKNNAAKADWTCSGEARTADVGPDGQPLDVIISFTALGNFHP